MTVFNAIDKLLHYARDCGLIEETDVIFSRNTLMDILHLEEWAEPAPCQDEPLPVLLDTLTDYALEKGIIPDCGITGRDLFDTRIMGALTPRPSEVIRRFHEAYAVSPESATDWYYHFSQATNYIRRDRVQRDLRWTYRSRYGEIDITINLSKPEKDPKAIAAALNAKKSGYPPCLLCRENEGYAGNMTAPARQNHRILPLTLDGESWNLQYSPYVYYNEHCICFNSLHTPMHIDREALNKLCDFVTIFPHYFIGSNADLPIVGGSILTHDHYQGGHYTFAMERAPIELPLTFAGYEDIRAGIVKWPLSVIRLTAADRNRLCELGDKILQNWRKYTDESAFILAETEGKPHNTITPIARRRGTDYELDLVLRNNITTPEHPLGVYHPHEALHHIKKENIGLIEVMGLAVLPARLKTEMAKLQEVMLAGGDPAADETLAKHAAWAKDILARRGDAFRPDTADQILKEEIGAVFEKVLEDAGVFPCTPEGRQAFCRFVDMVNKA